MSVSQESISDILSNKAPSTESAPVESSTTDVTAAPSAAEPKADKSATTRDEHGKFAKAEAKADAAVNTTDVKTDPQTQPESAKPRADVAAIIDERRKRQALEKQLAELQATKPAAKVSVFDNEDEAIRSRVDEATRPLREAHYNLSIRYARQEHGEAFGNAETAFMEAAESNPGLYEGLRAAPDPGQYIYMHGTFHKEMSEVGGDILKYRAKVTADTATKLSETAKENAALKAEIESLRKSKTELEQIPTSLNARASASTGNVEVVKQEPLSELTRFGKQNR